MHKNIIDHIILNVLSERDAFYGQSKVVLKNAKGRIYTALGLPIAAYDDLSAFKI